MWLVFQSLIIIAISWMSIYWKWTPNPYATGVVAVGAAWLATKILTWIFCARKRENSARQ